MLISIVGINSPRSTCLGLKGGFEKLGHKVILIDYRRLLLVHGTENVVDKLRQIVMGVDLSVYMKFAPGVPKDAMLQLSKVAPSFLWYQDVWEHVPEEVCWHLKYARWASCTGRETARLAQSHSKREVHHIYDGADPEVYRPVAPKKNLKCDVSFVGTLVSYRKEVMGTLVDNGLDVGFRDGFYLDDFCAAARSAKVCLSLSRDGKTREQTHSVRLWQLMACGACVVSDNHVPSPHVRSRAGFHENKIATVMEDVKALLSLDDFARNEIGIGAREDVKAAFTWRHSAEKILEVVDA